MSSANARLRSAADPRLAAALGLAALFHGTLLATGTFKRTYDAFVHIFFADHYARWWFDLWETRWYTGFTVTSYPPASHQSIALLSNVIGLQPAYAVVQLAAVLLLVLGVYRFSRIWVHHRAAGYAAIGAAFATGIVQAVHLFGQLPTTLSLAFLLNALPAAHRWVERGRRRDLIAAWSALAATTAAHHVTTIFGAVFFLGPVLVDALIARFRCPLADEDPERPGRVTAANFRPLVMRRLRRVWRPTMRAGVLGVGMLLLLVVVVLPYWLWSRSDPITQMPIPHASRDSFLKNRSAGFTFWLVPWGPALLFLPFAVARGIRSRAWPLTLSLLLATLLGTGGTTPLPRMLLGGAYEILTLDRFTFWATILALPLLGYVAASLRRGRGARFLLGTAGRSGLLMVRFALVVMVVATALATANLAGFRPFQPDPIDPGPITAFIEKDQHWRWRYLTLGFGDQMAWLSTQTTALTVDGNYHSARRLPELTSTPVERLEGAKFRGVPGIGSLQQFLAVPEKYHLKYVFSNDEFYDPLLYFSGWHRLQRLENGIEVWERADVPPLPDVLPRREYPTYQRLMWGILPLAAVGAGLTSVVFGARQPRRERVRRVRQGRITSAIDGALHRWSALPGVADGRAEPSRIRRMLSRRSKRLRTMSRLLIVAVVLTATVPVVVLTGSEARPEHEVIAYYDDLDFRRFRAAWQRLDPATRPTYEQYDLELSVGDGLLAAYAKLDSIRTITTQQSETAATITADLTYVTSLSEYRISIQHELRNVDGTWYLEPDPLSLAEPPERFFRRATVDFGTQGRRLPTTGTTTYSDVLDRPELAIRSARLYRLADRYVLVGEMTNIDVDPADISITAQLTDADGKVLARYNAHQDAIHKLRPLETTGFRVEFEGVAGTAGPGDQTAGHFRPGLYTPLSLPADALVAGVDIYAKALVTGHDLERGLVVEELDVRAGPNGEARVSGRLTNLGTSPATVPRVLVTLYDAAGEVAWVAGHYLPEAIRPGRSRAFSAVVTEAADVQATGVEPRVFVNGIPARPLPDGGESRVGVPQATGYHTVQVTADAFRRAS